MHRTREQFEIEWYPSLTECGDMDIDDRKFYRYNTLEEALNFAKKLFLKGEFPRIIRLREISNH